MVQSSIQIRPRRRRLRQRRIFISSSDEDETDLADTSAATSGHIGTSDQNSTSVGNDDHMDVDMLQASDTHAPPAADPDIPLVVPHTEHQLDAQLDPETAAEDPTGPYESDDELGDCSQRVWRLPQSTETAEPPINPDIPLVFRLAGRSWHKHFSIGLECRITWNYTAFQQRQDIES